jgi:hypothetical protein
VIVDEVHAAAGTKRGVHLVETGQPTRFPAEAIGASEIAFGAASGGPRMARIDPQTEGNTVHRRQP